MAGEDAPVDFGQVFAGICDNNGQFAIGLGAGADARNPPQLCIPVPQNIFQQNTEKSRLRTARWAYDTVMAMTDDQFGYGVERKTHFAVMCYAAYMTGLVRYTRPQGAWQVPDGFDAAAIRAVAWDAEVRVLEEGIDDQRETAPPAPVTNDATYMKKILNLVFAAKITWQQCKHHLGSRVARHVNAREWQGFTEKTASLLKLPGVGYGTNEDRAFLHALIHPCSTIGCINLLSAEKYPQAAATLRATYDAIRTADDTPIRALRPVFMNDIEVRAGQPGAGCRKMADLLRGLMCILTSPIAPLMPEQAQIIPFVNAWLKIKMDPYRYGENAHYLTLQSREVDTTAMDRLAPIIKTFVDICLRNSTLRYAAVFSSDPSGDTGFNPQWKVVCSAYMKISTRGSAIDQETLVDMMKQYGGVVGSDLSDNMAAVIAQLQINVPKESWNKAARAFRDAMGVSDDEDSDGDGGEEPDEGDDSQAGDDDPGDEPGAGPSGTAPLPKRPRREPVVVTKGKAEKAKEKEKKSAPKKTGSKTGGKRKPPE
jgi:hypothetical protein